MNTGLKWIGGATLAAVALIGTLAFGGDALVAQGQDAEMSSWMDARDVLGTAPDDVDLAMDIRVDARPQSSDTQPAAAAEPAFVAQPVVQDTAAYSADNPFVIKRILPISGPIRYGEWHWDDDGVPPGPLVMTVDLEARVISVFRGGYEIGAAAALIGSPEHPTPLGTFPILTKERHNVSEQYNNAPMPWTLRLTWDGVAIHGGSTVELGYASHGCIGVPDEFASRLYAIARTGDQVIITRGQTATIGSALAG